MLCAKVSFASLAGSEVRQPRPKANVCVRHGTVYVLGGRNFFAFFPPSAGRGNYFFD